jgi:hypothetical protein
LLHLLVLELVHVVWSELLLQEIVEQLFVLDLCPLFLLLKGFLASFWVGCSISLFLAYWLFRLQVFIRTASRCTLVSHILVFLGLFWRCISATCYK